jgi:hypothetical protein
MAPVGFLLFLVRFSGGLYEANILQVGQLQNCPNERVTPAPSRTVHCQAPGPMWARRLGIRGTGQSPAVEGQSGAQSSSSPAEGSLTNRPGKPAAVDPMFRWA